MALATQAALVLALVVPSPGASEGPSPDAANEADPDHVEEQTAEEAAMVEAFNDHIDRAVGAKDRGELDDALRQLDLALLSIRTLTDAKYDDVRGRALYHKALVLVALERWEQAQTILRTLELSPGLDDKSRQIVRERLSQVERELAKEQEARRPVKVRIEVTNASDATVEVDGREVGMAPVVIERPSGAYQVKVTREGYAPYQTELTIAAQEGQVLRVALLRESLTRSQIAGIALGASAGALGVVGAVLHGVGNSEVARADRPDQLWTHARDLAEAGALKRNVGFAMYGVAGGALVVMAAVLAGGRWSEEDRGSAPSVRMVPLDRGAILGWSGRF